MDTKLEDAGAVESLRFCRRYKLMHKKKIFRRECYPFVNMSDLNGCFHCVKSVRIRSFSGLYFPAFGQYTKIYCPNAGKYGPEKISYLDTFHAVFIMSGRHFLGILNQV